MGAPRCYCTCLHLANDRHPWSLGLVLVGTQPDRRKAIPRVELRVHSRRSPSFVSEAEKSFPHARRKANTLLLCVGRRSRTYSSWHPISVVGSEVLQYAPSAASERLVAPFGCCLNHLAYPQLDG